MLPAETEHLTKVRVWLALRYVASMKRRGGTLADERNNNEDIGGPVLDIQHFRIKRFAFEALHAYNDRYMLGQQTKLPEESAEMQAPTSQRSIQRRSPVADPGPTVPGRSISPGEGPQTRTSSSTKSIPNGSTRRQNVSRDLEACRSLTLPYLRC